jgi:hypothetical protein
MAVEVDAADADGMSAVQAFGSYSIYAEGHDSQGIGIFGCDDEGDSIWAKLSEREVQQLHACGLVVEPMGPRGKRRSFRRPETHPPPAT